VCVRERIHTHIWKSVTITKLAMSAIIGWKVVSGLLSLSHRDVVVAMFHAFVSQQPSTSEYNGCLILNQYTQISNQNIYLSYTTSDIFTFSLFNTKCQFTSSVYSHSKVKDEKRDH
jgi:hypothetical protein